MFNWLWKKRHQEPKLSNIDRFFYNYTTGVNETSVLGIPAVVKALSLISGYIARLPFKLYQKTDRGRIQVPHNFPAKNYTQFTFFRSLINQMLLNGTSFAKISFDAFADPVDLVIISNKNKKPKFDNGELYYGDHLASDMIVLKNLSLDGLEGINFVEKLKAIFELSLNLQSYGNDYFSKNKIPQGIIEMPGFFKSEEEIKKLQEGWKNENLFWTKVLQGGAKFVVPEQGSNREKEYCEIRRFQNSEIANLFNLPQHFLVPGPSSYSSIEQENKALLASLEPHLCNIEQEFFLKLLTQEQKDNGFYFEFERAALERSDYKTEIDCLIAQVNNGILTLGQALEKLNLPLPDDDQRRRPANILIEGEQNALSV